MEISNRFPWILPWQAISAEGQDAYRLEVSLEVTPGHPLFGVRVTPLARRCDSDDVLFELHHHPARFAVVHLTFTGAPEAKLHWPSVTLYSNMEHWVSARMMPDVAYYETHGHRRAA